MEARSRGTSYWTATRTNLLVGCIRRSGSFMSILLLCSPPHRQTPQEPKCGFVAFVPSADGALAVLLPCFHSDHNGDRRFDVAETSFRKCEFDPRQGRQFRPWRTNDRACFPEFQFSRIAEELELPRINIAIATLITLTAGCTPNPPVPGGTRRTAPPEHLLVAAPRPRR
jgi:hypothetical protein